MANSLIEDMFAESNQYESYKDFKNSQGNKNKKGGGKKIFLFLIILIIIGALGLAVYLFLNSSKKSTVLAKTELMNYLGQVSLVNENQSSMNAIADKLINNSSSLKSKVNISSNIAELEEFTKFTAEIDSKYDSKNHRGLIDFNFDYLNNPIFDMQALITGQKIALKSDEIVIMYVGYNYSGLLNESTNMSGEIETYEEEFSEEEIYEESYDINTIYEMINSPTAIVIEFLEKFDYETLISSFTLEFLQSEFVKYVQVLNVLDESNFSKKEVAIERDAVTVDATAYVVTLNETELITLTAELLKELQNDSDLISILVESCESLELGIDETLIKEFIDTLINYTYTLDGNVDEIYTFTVYVSDSKVTRISLVTSTISIDFDYINEKNNNKYIVTALEKENNNGIKLEFNRITEDDVERTNINFSLISNNEVVCQATGNLSFEGINSKSSMKINLSFGYADTENEFDLNIDTDVEFEDVEIEDLTNQNCLFLDELTEEEQIATIEAIKTRTLEIFQEKQEQINLINSNTDSSSIIGGNDSSIYDNAQAAQDKVKIAQIQEKITLIIAQEMVDAAMNGVDYTLENLLELQIDGSEVQVTIENDIAIIVVDEHTFKLNSLFEFVE